MDSDYKFTMSPEDQQKFVSISRGSKYGDLLRNLKKNLDSQNKNVDFKEQSSSKFVLSQIDKKMMKELVNAFPINLPLNSTNIHQFSEQQLSMQAPPEKLYDPRFVIPLLYHVVSPSLFVDCRDFIARRCLAVTLMGLSSEDPQMRALCYKILERYYEHLLSALLIDKQLWVNFLDLIRNSIPTPNAKLRYIFATFLVRLIDVLLHPDNDKMYELVKEFLSGRPRLRIDTIEIYQDLLLCSDVDYYNNNVRWLVTLFRDGLQSQGDLKVLQKLDAVPQIMCLYNSELRFERANETIISLFIRIVSVPLGSTLLVNDYSFLPWLHLIILNHINQDISSLKNDSKSESIVDIAKSISSLVFALVDSLLCKKSSTQEPISPTRILELINVFIALHDLVIKSKNGSILSSYLDYSKKVAKALKSDEKIKDDLAVNILTLIRAKMPYLT